MSVSNVVASSRRESRAVVSSGCHVRVADLDTAHRHARAARRAHGGAHEDLAPIGRDLTLESDRTVQLPGVQSPRLSVIVAVPDAIAATGVRIAGSTVSSWERKPP
jgi:hypothetical protein